MSDLISRKALCEYALNQKDKSITPNDIMRFPSAQPEKRTEERTETHACDCIERQAAIDAHYEYCNKHPDAGFPVWSLKILEDLPPAQQDLSGYSDRLWKAAYERGKAEAQQRWIPCSERLPEEQKKSYWVCTDSSYQCECRWTNINHFWTQLTTDWHWHLMDIPQHAKIVAWMPLPEPYREGAQE